MNEKPNDYATKQFNNIQTVLFDLDGTLADTAGDLANALNATLKHEGKAPLAFEKIRPHVSHGGIALIKLGFQIPVDHPEFEKLRQFFLASYKKNICQLTKLFHGMNEVLQTLQTAGINWGIVTNKPGYLTDPLVEVMDFPNQPICVVSGDTTDNRKPHPEPMIHASSIAGSKPGNCLYVGDAKRDIEAGLAAGMSTLIAMYGYINDDDQPEDWGADGIVNAPVDILSWLPISRMKQAQ
jgi:phosphoglycolate phosphatase